MIVAFSSYFSTDIDMVFVFLVKITPLIYVFVTDVGDNLDFNDFDNDLSTSKDNLEFKKNVMMENELGCDGCDEDDCAIVVDNEDHDANDLECLSSEELFSNMPSDNELWYQSPEFTAKMDIQDPHFQVGQLFSSIWGGNSNLWCHTWI